MTNDALNKSLRERRLVLYSIDLLEFNRQAFARHCPRGESFDDWFDGWLSQLCQMPADAEVIRNEDDLVHVTHNVLACHESFEPVPVGNELPRRVVNLLTPAIAAEQMVFPMTFGELPGIFIRTLGDGEQVGYGLPIPDGISVDDAVRDLREIVRRSFEAMLGKG